jgi:hypothetical protein
MERDIAVTTNHILTGSADTIQTALFRDTPWAGVGIYRFKNSTILIVPTVPSEANKATGAGDSLYRAYVYRVPFVDTVFALLEKGDVGVVYVEPE